MKKQLLLTCAIFVSTIAFTQEKFYTDNGKTLVTELKTGMSDVKVVLPIPEEYSNHDLIEVAIDYFAGDKSKPADFLYRKEYKIDFLKEKNEVSIWIKSPGSQTGDFCYNGDCFELDYPAIIKNRNYTDGTISVRFFGKDINGYEWKNGIKVPTYQYSKPLSKHNIKINYGPIIETNKTEKGTFKGYKYFGSEAISEMYLEKGSEEMTSAFSSKRIKAYNKHLEFDNPIYFHLKDVSGVGENSQQITVDYIRTGIILDLFHSANPGSNNYIKGISGSYFSRKLADAIYMPMVMKNAKSNAEIAKEKKEKEDNDLKALFGKPYNAGSTLPKSNTTSAHDDKGKAYETHVKEQGEKLEWVSGKIGGVEMQILKLEVYNEDQMGTQNDNYVLKDGEEVNSKIIWYFVGEKNGKIIAGSIFTFKHKVNTAEENEFIEKMIASYEIK